MRRHLLPILILALLSPPAFPVDPVPVPRADVPRPATPDLGVNIEGLSDYARSHPFVDALKAARRFGTPAAPWDEKAPVDDNGWPTADAGLVVFADTNVPPGDYTFTCTNPCTIAISGGNAEVKSQAYDRASNTTLAILRVAEGSPSLFLSFTNTRNKGIKNAKLLRPGYRTASNATFTRDYLALLAPFSTIRSMDFTRTNDTDIVEWADRPKPTDARQTSQRGVAWEYVIQLANDAKKDLWINIPDRASDDYVRNLAKLCKEKLDPDRNLYIEYSNEVWNAMFGAYHRNFEAAKAEVAAGDKQLNDNGKDDNQYFWGWKRVAKRLLQIAALFREVYGNDAMLTRIRPVLASQTANPFMARLQLEYVEKYHGPPNTLIYGIAGAPYLDPGEAMSKNQNAAVQELIAAMNPDGAIKGWTREFLILARYYRLHHLCYEGGIALEGDPSLPAKIAANRDPRIAPKVRDYFTMWYGQGGELFMYYNLASPYTRFGTWGLTDNPAKPSPKLNAVLDLLKAPTPPLAEGIVLPARIEAAKFDAHQGGDAAKAPDGTLCLTHLHPGHYADYLLLVKDPGRYTLSLDAQGTGEVELLVSTTPIATIPVQTSGSGTWSRTTPVSVDLAQGQLVLRLRIKSAGMNIRAIAIEKSPA